MSRVFVTGAIGFIGYHVCERLLDDGKVVVGYAAISEEPRSEWRLAKLQQHANYVHIWGNVRTPGFRFIQPGCDVIHLAAATGVRESVVNPDHYMNTNVNGTMNVLRACKDVGVKNIVIASSSTVYGNTDGTPSRETDQLNPISPYAASKVAAEAIAKSYAHLYDMNISLLRYFSVYGPCGRPDMAIGAFAKAIAKGEPVHVNTNPLLARDWTYVDDIVTGTIRAFELKGCNTINIGNGKPITLKDTIAYLREVSGENFMVGAYPKSSADATTTCSHNATQNRLLGNWKRVGIMEGLANTLDWERKHGKALD